MKSIVYTKKLTLIKLMDFLNLNDENKVVL